MESAAMPHKRHVIMYSCNKTSKKHQHYWELYFYSCASLVVEFIFYVLSNFEGLVQFNSGNYFDYNFLRLRPTNVRERLDTDNSYESAQ